MTKFRWPREKKQLMEHLDSLKPGLAHQHTVEVKSSKPKSNEQNAFFWKTIVEPVCEEVGETRSWGEQVLYRQILQPECAPTKVIEVCGKQKTVLKGISEMTADEMTNFIQRCQAYVSTELLEGFRWAR